jgi:1,4-dihydroxy-2-naphthoyl-CoA synthase
LREELQKKPFIHIQQDSISRLAKVRVSDEAVEGLNAFIEKRDPVWRKKTDQIKA